MTVRKMSCTLLWTPPTQGGSMNSCLDICQTTGEWESPAGAWELAAQGRDFQNELVLSVADPF